jgi:hypothetical protein
MTAIDAKKRQGLRSRGDAPLITPTDLNPAATRDVSGAMKLWKVTILVPSAPAGACCGPPPATRRSGASVAQATAKRRDVAPRRWTAMGKIVRR